MFSLQPGGRGGGTRVDPGGGSSNPGGPWGAGAGAGAVVGGGLASAAAAAGLVRPAWPIGDRRKKRACGLVDIVVGRDEAALGDRAVQHALLGAKVRFRFNTARLCVHATNAGRRSVVNGARIVAISTRGGRETMYDARVEHMFEIFLLVAHHRRRVILGAGGDAARAGNCHFRPRRAK